MTLLFGLSFVSVIVVLGRGGMRLLLMLDVLLRSSIVGVVLRLAWLGVERGRGRSCRKRSLR